MLLKSSRVVIYHNDKLGVKNSTRTGAWDQVSSRKSLFSNYIWLTSPIVRNFTSNSLINIGEILLGCTARERTTSECRSLLGSSPASTYLFQRLSWVIYCCACYDVLYYVKEPETSVYCFARGVFKRPKDFQFFMAIPTDGDVALNSICT